MPESELYLGRGAWPPHHPASPTCPLPGVRFISSCFPSATGGESIVTISSYSSDAVCGHLRPMKQQRAENNLSWRAVSRVPSQPYQGHVGCAAQSLPVWLWLLCRGGVGGGSSEPLLPPPPHFTCPVPCPHQPRLTSPCRQKGRALGTKRMAIFESEWVILT